MNESSAPKLSLTDSVTLSLNELRDTLAGRMAHDPSRPHVSLNAATNDPERPLRSRGKRVFYHYGNRTVSDGDRIIVR
jgi:hypothetical protein